jgi:four helix bundle protein
MNKRRQLVAWQYCRELAREIYRITAGFPAAEQYGLSGQLRRAAVSTAANIAEGHARFGRAEFAHALSLALGSLAEVDTLLGIANDLKLLSPVDYETLMTLRDRASRATFGLQRRARP